MQQASITKKHFFLSLLIIAFILGLVLLSPLITTIVISAAVSVVFYPVYKWLKKKVCRDISWLASILTVILFIIIVCVPVFFLGVAGINQAQDMYAWISTHGGLEGQLAKIDKFLTNFFPQEFIRLEDYASSITAKITGSLGTVFSVAISTLISFFLVVLTTFYFLKDGAHWRQTIVELSPLSDENDHRIIDKLRHAINSVFRGYLFIGFVQGAVMTIGLWVFGVPNPALWGMAACIASLVPMLGTALVSLPAIGFLFVTGHPLSAVGLAAWSMIVVGTIDNILNPFIVGRKIDIHPLLVLFSVLGGLFIIGPTGILIGPLIISFLYALVSVYKSEML
jgi:predicted PurR-regulated permease PerM